VAKARGWREAGEFRVRPARVVGRGTIAPRWEAKPGKKLSLVLKVLYSTGDLEMVLEPVAARIVRHLTGTWSGDLGAMAATLGLSLSRVRSEVETLKQEFGASSPDHLLIRLVAKTDRLPIEPGFSEVLGERLAPGQVDLLRRRFQGRSDAQILSDLGISRSTLTNRKGALNRKLGCRSLTEAVLWVLTKSGLAVSRDEPLDWRHLLKVAALASSGAEGRPGAKNPKPLKKGEK
jgi:DNA-binding CsgD family transcriptional regulator